MADDPTSPGSGSAGFFRELDTEILVHDLKSPLSLIEATARTLLEHGGRLGPLTGRQERALQRILRGAVRGRRTVEHLLEIGRAESSQFVDSTFDPAEAVRDVLLDAAESYDSALAGRLEAAGDDRQKLAALAQVGIRLIVEAGADHVRMRQDRVKFELIVGNLIQNALRFRKQVLDVVLAEDRGTLAVTVRDDGPGIPPEYQEVVFERYKQAPADEGLQRKGHGLGLAGARILARRLGGDITLASVPGRGTTFRLALPTVRASGNG
jgi:signal transduction histidine kinase